MRTRQKRSKEPFCSDLMKWYSTARKRLIRTGKNDDYDKKWDKMLGQTLNFL